MILGNKKFNTDSNQSQSRKSKRLSSPPPGETSSAWVYPNDCQLCGKCRLQYKNKRYVPYTIATFNAAESIKAAAKVKNETLFNEIEHLDLIAKEFKVHHVCYKKFTLGYSPASRAENLMEEDNELKECMYRKANFEEVVEYIRDSVLHLKKAASMKTLQEISGIESSDRRYRQTLKKRIEKEFGNQITFLSSNINLPEIIVSSEYFTSTTVHHDDNSTLKLAAKILQNDIIAKYKENPTSTWPPTANDLESDKFKPPNSVIDFMKSVLSLENRSKETSVNMTRMAESFAQDLVFGVTRGKVLQLKHFLLALGLHSLSGSRKVIDIVSKFGHCLNYNLVCEIETSQAELAQKQLSNKTSLPLQPISSDNFVYTHFWVDNFDVLVDKQTGGGSIHTTHLVAFQEKSTESLQLNNQLSVSRRKSRDLPAQNFDTKLLLIERKKNPPSTLYQHTTTYNDASFNRQHFLWIFLRKNNSFQQTVPIFKGWMLKMRSAHKPTSIIEKTIETYLPPINAKVTEFGTIQRYMIYLQKLASEVNMTYVNITLDVGAAMNAFLVTWNAPELFNNIIIHLGGFHFLKENFQVNLIGPNSRLAFML